MRLRLAYVLPLVLPVGLAVYLAARPTAAGARASAPERSLLPAEEPESSKATEAGSRRSDNDGEEPPATTGPSTPASKPPAAAKPRKPADHVSFSKQVAPVLEKYCLKCHGGAKPRASFALDKIRTDEQADSARKTWEKMVQALQAREMPPQGKPQLSAAERDLVLKFLDQRLAAVDCTRERDPGRVTLRRLNRTEYNNTIRDLVGVTFKPAEDFPADDVGYGFDNIGDVLSMSPLLMEKYLAAAERIVEQALEKAPSGAGTRRYARNELEPRARGFRGQRFRPLTTNGEVFVRHNFPRDGEYVFRILAYGEQAGNEPVKMALRVDGKEVKVFEVRDRAPKVYEIRARVRAGTHPVAAAFLNDFYDSKIEDPGQRDRNLHVGHIEVEVPPTVTQTASQRLAIVRPEGLSKDQAARKIVETFAPRAFRRPVTKAEVDRYLKLYALGQSQGESFEKSVGLAVQGILVSPHFLFKVERDPPGKAGEAHLISEFELATRLSYFLWSTTPDQELLDLAVKGQLRKSLDAVVRRMLKDERAQALAENFGGQWLEWRNLKAINPDRGTFPGFDPTLRAAMVREGELFFGAIIKEDRNVLDFLDADFTFVNDRLARHYDLRGVRGRDFQRVTLPKDSPRGGILTLASVLTVTSNPTRTSPVKRGKWILENVLNSPPPPPPPDAGELNEAKEVAESAPLRKRMEMHRFRPDCVSCHARMDPLGFALENFDGIGNWRTKDGRFPVDATGVLPSGEKFDGPRELKTVLRKQRGQQFARCLAEKMLTYSLGRGVEYHDKCALDDIVAALSKDNYRFSRLVIEVVKSDPFQKRRPRAEPAAGRGAGVLGGDEAGSRRSDNKQRGKTAK